MQAERGLARMTDAHKTSEQLRTRAEMSAKSAKSDARQAAQQLDLGIKDAQKRWLEVEDKLTVAYEELDQGEARRAAAKAAVLRERAAREAALDGEEAVAARQAEAAARRAAVAARNARRAALADTLQRRAAAAAGGAMEGEGGLAARARAAGAALAALQAAKAAQVDATVDNDAALAEALLAEEGEIAMQRGCAVDADVFSTGDWQGGRIVGSRIGGAEGGGSGGGGGTGPVYLYDVQFEDGSVARRLTRASLRNRDIEQAEREGDERVARERARLARLHAAVRVQAAKAERVLHSELGVCRGMQRTAAALALDVAAAGAEAGVVAAEGAEADGSALAHVFELEDTVRDFERARAAAAAAAAAAMAAWAAADVAQRAAAAEAAVAGARKHELEEEEAAKRAAEELARSRAAEAAAAAAAADAEAAVGGKKKK